MDDQAMFLETTQGLVVVLGCAMPAWLTRWSTSGTWPRAKGFTPYLEACIWSTQAKFGYKEPWTHFVDWASTESGPLTAPAGTAAKQMWNAFGESASFAVSEPRCCLDEQVAKETGLPRMSHVQQHNMPVERTLKWTSIKFLKHIPLI